MIGKQFLGMGLGMMVLGGILALLVRWELAWPETAVPGMHWVPEPLMYDGVIPPETYNAFFTMHATIMIFFAVMPILVGCFGIFLIPLMIGARDLAFPLNALSFWTAILRASSCWRASPSRVAPPRRLDLVSTAQRGAGYTGVNWGQNLWCISLIVLGISSLMARSTYITTIVNMRAPGMTWIPAAAHHLALFVTAAAAPGASVSPRPGMLLFDRMAGTHFFTAVGEVNRCSGGTCSGSSVTPRSTSSSCPQWASRRTSSPTFSRKPIFGYHAMAFSIIGIAFLSWIVWGHHIPERHEPDARHELHADDDGHQGPSRHQDVQLARHAVGRPHPVPHRCSSPSASSRCS
jgi:cytochrome c oxidase subunit 1